MTPAEHYKQGEHYLSMASFFTDEPDPPKFTARPINVPLQNFFISLANSHFAAAQVGATILAQAQSPERAALVAAMTTNVSDRS